MRRWCCTLTCNPETGRFGLGLNDCNSVNYAPEGSGLMQYDIILGADGERLGAGSFGTVHAARLDGGEPLALKRVSLAGLPPALAPERRIAVLRFLEQLHLEQCEDEECASAAYISSVSVWYIF